MEIKLPVFIFYRDELFVTDQTEIWDKTLVNAPDKIEVFDAAAKPFAARRLDDKIVLMLDENAAVQEEVQKEEFKAKLVCFLRACDDKTAPEIESLPLNHAVDQTLQWMHRRAWKTYKRGSRMFWTLMFLCAILPFAAGLYKLQLGAMGRLLYGAIFLIVIASLLLLRRLLYPKPSQF